MPPTTGAIPQPLAELLAMLKRTAGSTKFNPFMMDPQLDNNPWEEPPEAVVKHGIDDISAYFTSLFSEAVTVQQNSIKVVLVGQEGAGKTR